MDVMALGFQKFETPFANGEIILEHGIALEDVPSGICGSGDQFEMEHNNTEYNVIEMEAFALAKVCKEEKLPFLCLKYISDGALRKSELYKLKPVLVRLYNCKSSSIKPNNIK